MSHTTEVIRIEANGDVYWNGRLVEGDEQFRACMIDLNETMKRTLAANSLYNAMSDERLMAKPAEFYDQKNPLGGPAKVFDAMAAAIRAGDSYHDVLTQFGYAEAKPAEEAQPGAQEPYCYIYEFDSWMGCHRSLSSAPRNGSNPSRSVAVYTRPTPETVRKLVREMEVIQNTITKQLELISERAPGDFLNKRPVVQALTSLRNRAKAALDAVKGG